MVNIDSVSSILWSIGGMLAIIGGVLREDKQVMILGVLAFILSYVIKLCVLSR